MIPSTTPMSLPNSVSEELNGYISELVRTKASLSARPDVEQTDLITAIDSLITAISAAGSNATGPMLISFYEKKDSIVRIASMRLSQAPVPMIIK